MHTLTIPTTDGRSFDGYLALPQGDGPAPGLVLLQYICGVNRVMRSLADGFAQLGYLVIAPDLYWRQGSNIRLLDDPSHPDPKEQARALELNAGFSDADAEADLVASLAAVRAHPRCDGRAGTLGYCLGGRLAYLMATRTDVDCAVGYYAMNLENYLDEAANIRRPLMLHMAGQDALDPEPVRTRICAVLQASALVDIHVHPGVDHAFALPGGANYNTQAAAQANAWSQEFLTRHLPLQPVARC